MFALKLAFKNVISRKSSLVIILFIAFSIAMLVVCNAVFDGTGSGIEQTFVQSFTGDIVIRPRASYPLSLFGDETPVTGSFSEVPELIPFSDIQDTLKSVPEIHTVIPQLTGQTVLNCNGGHVPAVLFGVDTQGYLSCMKGITIKEGQPYRTGEPGLMISTDMADYIKKDFGVELHAGQNVQIMAGTGNAFSMRSVPITAVYTYPVKNDVLSRIALISPDTLRELTGVSMTAEKVEIKSGKKDLIQEESGIDGLFEDISDTKVMQQEEQAKDPAASAVQQPAAVPVHTSWNFIICRCADGTNINRTIRILNTQFKNNGWNVQAVNWRTAAGMSAQYLYWMRLIFNAGIIVLLGTGLIVVNNTLVISALDRTHETGTMRALGAGRPFIAGQFMLETGMLTVFAGITGCLLGVWLNSIVNSAHITFTNTYLIQLFGGSRLSTIITKYNIIRCMALSVLLAVIGWLYPVRIALAVSPVTAMQGAR